jgi:diguanylate cyclase (GGDEF)-like protein
MFSRERSFRGANIDLARKVSKVGWPLGIAIGYALLPFYPPTAHGAEVGWLVIGATTPLNAVWIYYVLRHNDRFGFDTLLAMTYLSALNVALVQWLAGGMPAPYHELYPFIICQAATAHPPRRFYPFMAAIAVVAVVPELGNAAELGDVVTELVLWLGASVMLSVTMWKIRQHRADLQDGAERASELARVDPLTGLGNRRAFEEALSMELARAQRQGTELALLVCDLDSFKQINDRYGHLSGDDCLRQTAAALRDQLRQTDTCFRWGGDEFAVLLPATGDELAAEVAARLDEHVPQTCTRPDGEPLRITSGHALLADGMSGEELLGAADAALRERKAQPQRSASTFTTAS